MEKAIELFKQGMSYSAIAKETGYTRNKVTRYLKKMGHYHEVPEKVLKANTRTAKLLTVEHRYICCNCGNEFVGKVVDRNKYCSRECYFDTIKKQAKLRPPKSPKPPKPPITCVICGKKFQGRADSKHCSDDCRKEQARRKHHDTVRANYKAPSYTCKGCGRVFAPDYGEKNRVYCSANCLYKTSKRIAKSTRRARLRGAHYSPIDPLYILGRDGWRCMICGVRTPKKRRGTTHPHAPEVDHIVPLALGGSHAKDNLQCLCRKCNQDKGATTYGQTRLWA